MKYAFVKDNNVIIKSNRLIESSYKLTTNEQKLILIFASLVKTDDKDFKTYKVQVKDLIEKLDLQKSKSAYEELKKITLNLMKKVIIINVPSDDNSNQLDTIQLNWFSSVKYLNGRGIIEAHFDPTLKPFLLNLKERFTSYKLQNIICMNSSYSIRIYEILKQYQTIGKRIISIIKLKEMLGISQKKYSRYNNLKQKVILTAYKEINEKTDINFEFEEIKSGRKVDKIKFIIHSKKIEKLDSNNPLEEMTIVKVADIYKKSIVSNSYIKELKNIIQEDLSNEELEAILNVAHNNIEKIKEKYQIAKLSKYNNLVGFLISAILKDYKISKKNNQSNTSNRFHNFEQRTLKYSREELENIIDIRNQDRSELPSTVELETSKED